MSELISSALNSVRVESSGVVYGTLLNHVSALRALGEKVFQPPYGAPPKAPVLYIKPRNTIAQSGDVVCIPKDVAELEVAACLGVVIGRTACRVSADKALSHVAGYAVVNDVSVPHPDYYRPALRYKARDGYCPIGVVTNELSGDADSLDIRTYIDGGLIQTFSTRDLVRPIGRLICDVTEFITLYPGDILVTGAAAPVPRVRTGQTVRIEIDGLKSLSNLFAAEDT
jgi:5-oxopent-3-ene-1,2,5-tricarboxylate decarboxylase / 2-hydroxyhepta-2,4-diene-1,7-dioate isomerase